MGFINNLLNNSSQVDTAALATEYGNLLIEGEVIEMGFKVFRDVFLFTNKRLILIDKQGLTGKKVEYLSVNYKNITRFSLETAGTFDLDSDLKIWVASEAEPSIVKKIERNVNVLNLQKILATHVLK